MGIGGSAPRPATEYLRFDSAYDLHSFGSWTSGRAEYGQLFLPYTHIAVGGDPARIYLSDASGYEIREFSLEGLLLRIIRRAHEPIAVLEEEFWTALERNLEANLNSWVGGPAPPAELLKRQEETQRKLNEEWGFTPHFLPPVSGLVVDEKGYLWVRDRWNFVRPGRWSVFDPKGRWLGDVETPVRRTKIRRWIGEDFVLGEGPGKYSPLFLEGFRLNRRIR